MPPRRRTAASGQSTLSFAPKPHVADLVVRQHVKPAAQESLSEEDKRALKMSKQDLNRYWKKEEQGRLAPRVHQKDLAMEEKILRHFDLSNQYGPCIGIARIQRWRRANKLKLNPPLEVLAVLLKNEEIENGPIWMSCFHKSSESKTVFSQGDEPNHSPIAQQGHGVGTVHIGTNYGIQRVMNEWAFKNSPLIYQRETALSLLNRRAPYLPELPHESPGSIQGTLNPAKMQQYYS
ncbi:hypothetical protein N7509_011282 [Penicillium cosmopolitanum]|uniref:DNA polymerase delta subunit 4 n=1 Tax=Penicillium cosmopolitanum TaxID=1131564 RepID=A0A9W9VSW7_9EURO|nr:uncharacterized protein N7509_011282 [Penicillium cosmopolitanum]KAJ5388741.1 hypothetical protein N7509_011282 [Penicillium cosmopolitanum]